MANRPLPFSDRMPEPKPVAEWPPEVQAAMMELIAFAVNERSEVMTFNLEALRHGELDLGSWKITVAQVG